MNLKKAFTIAEVSVAIVMLGVLVASTVPLIKKTRPNKSILQIKKTYFALERAVATMINDDLLYPSIYGDGDCESTGDESGYVGFECAQGNGSASYNDNGTRKNGTHFDTKKFPCYISQYITGRNKMIIGDNHKTASGTTCSANGVALTSAAMSNDYTLDYSENNATRTYTLGNVFRYDISQGMVMYIEDRAFSDRMRKGQASWTETYELNKCHKVCASGGQQAQMGDAGCGHCMAVTPDAGACTGSGSGACWWVLSGGTVTRSINHAEITPITERMVRDSVIAIVVDTNGPNKGPNRNAPATGVTADDLDTYTVLIHADGKMEILEYWAIEAMKVSKDTKRD